MSRVLPRHTQSRSNSIKKLTTVTSGSAASDAALVAKYLAKDTVPGDFDASALPLAEIPPESACELQQASHHGAIRILADGREAQAAPPPRGDDVRDDGVGGARVARIC